MSFHFFVKSIKRRDEEKIKKKQEDKEYMDKLVNRNAGLSEKQKLLEDEIKLFIGYINYFILINKNRNI
jgi:hypothetical protein